MKKALAIAAMLLVCSTLMYGSALAEEMTADDVIGTVLTDYQVLFAETAEDMAANGAEYFYVGEGNGVLTVTEEGLEFFVKKNKNSFFISFQRLDATGNCIAHNQALHIKFKTTTDQFEITLSGGFGVTTAMHDSRTPYFHLPEYAYNEPYGNIQIKAGQWYHLLMAVDTEGVFQCAIWKDGDEANAAYINRAIGQSYEDWHYIDQSWEPSVQTWGESTFTLESYEHYTFTGFVEEGQMVEVK